jgi:hypothetical protein
MRAMKLADVRKRTGGAMTLEEANKLVGNQPTTCIANMTVALSLHTWNNTADDWRWLEAALVVRNHRRRQQQERY